MKASYHCAVMLIRVFAGCTCDIVDFAVLWLICEFNILTAKYYIFMCSGSFVILTTQYYVYIFTNVKQYFTKKQWFYDIFSLTL